MPKADRVASNAAIASAAQAATMVTGGVLAVIVAATVGNNAQTDGFFAAFAIYSTVVAFAQSTRTTIIARLLEGRERFDVFDRFLGAGVVVFLVAVLAFGALGGPLAHALTGSLPPDAYDAARFALWVFIPASGLQLFAALGAGMLGALGDFARAGVAFVGGSLVSIVAFLALRPAMGIDGLSVALLIGSVVSSALVVEKLVRLGWRPSATSVADPRAAARAASVLTVSSVSFLVAQVGYLVLLALGARLGVGVVTVFSYATMAMGLMQAIFVSSVPMVMAAPLSQSWDRRPETLLPHQLAVVRTGMLLVTPVLAVAPLIGTQVLGVVFAEFTAAQVHLLVALFLILSANVVCGLVSAVPYAALVGIGRYVALGGLTAIAVAAQTAFGIAARETGSVHLLAVSDPAGTLVTVVGAFLLVAPGYWRVAALPVFLLIARFLLTGLAAFGVPWLLLERVAGEAAPWLAAVVGAGIYLLLVTRLPADRDIVGRLGALVPRPRATA